MSANHPTPWRLDFDEIWPAVTDWPILDANGEPVVITDSGCYPPDNETAREIVEAVNAHENLRKLVRDLLVIREYLHYHVRADGTYDRTTAPDPDEVEALLRRAREAIGGEA